MSGRRARILWALSVTAAATVLGVSAASALGGVDAGPAPGAVAPHGVSPAGVRVPSAVSAPTVSQSEFHSITPCTIVNTKHAIAKGSTRGFYVRGGSNFVPQGGTAGGCGIPSAATSVAANVTAFTGSGNGFLQAFPYGSTSGGSDFARFYGDRASSSNPILRLSATAAGPDVSIGAAKAASKVSIEVTGYYEPPIEGLIYTGSSTTPGSGYEYSGSPRILSVTWVAVGIADVTLDTDVTYCTPVAGGYYDSTYFANAKGFTKNTVRVYSWYYNTTSHLNVAVNNYVYLTVTC